MSPGKFVVWDGNHRVKAVLNMLRSGHLEPKQKEKLSYFAAEILHPDTPVEALYRIISSMCVSV